MSIEVELKARLSDPQAVRKHLNALVSGVVEVYRDTYFEPADSQFGADGYELRVRTIESADGTRHLLTFKEPPIHASGSKPEYETMVSDPHFMGRILIGLGFQPMLSLTKQCVNYHLTRGYRQVLATVVTVPDIDGTYLEVETLAEPDDVDEALADVRDLLHEVGVADEELTRDTYIAAVHIARSGGCPPRSTAPVIGWRFR